MDKKTDSCQADDVCSLTTPQPKVLYWIERAKTHGISGTLDRLTSLLVSRKPAQLASRKAAAVKTAPAAKPPAAAVCQTLAVQAGDLVEVKSLEEIQATLDGNGKCKGLLFMPEMQAHCGQRLRVYKRVERILIETTGELRRMKNTLLLENSICDGWNGACHRSCFYFWRDAWLRKVE